MLEETLWAHFFYHCIVLNYRSSVTVNHIRKHELTNLFESRTDNTALQSHEDLSNYLKTIGKNGQKKLFEKLREHVKMPPYTNESQSGN